MLLSKSCEYGMRATLYVSSIDEEAYVPIRVISGDLGISAHFLTKILQQLTRAGVMKSFKGPRGGVALALPASEISLMEIIEAIDGPDLFSECMLGLPGCGERKPCPLHDRWAEERARLYRLFSETKIEEIAEPVGDNRFRLSP